MNHAAHRASLSRRRLLTGAAAVGLGGASLGALVSRASAGSPAAVGGESLSRSRHVLLHTGLTHGAWVPSEPGSSRGPSAGEFARAGFTTPTYYEAPLYNAELQRSLRASRWALAHAPSGGQLTGPPPGGGLQLPAGADLKRLHTVCFGDEEPYSDALVGWLAQYYSLLRRQAPWALAHNNQARAQWSEAQLRTYLRTAKPDLLTFDAYYFAMQTGYPGGSVTPLYDALSQYRRLALEGVDGSGRYPIQFGQYTLGYRTGNQPADGGYYVISQSQQWLVPNVTWTMGGTWLNMFRWLKHWTPSLLHYHSGRPTVQYTRYRDINSTMAALSAHLIRLRSTDVRLVYGRHRVGGGSARNPASAVPAWSRGAAGDPAITDITATNRGRTNDGLPGDVLIGYFRPLEGLGPDQLRYLPGSRYFMITNCLVAPNTKPTDANSTGGSGADTAQTIRVTFDLTGRDPGGLRLVDPYTGRSVPVPLTRLGGNTYRLDLRLHGGTSALYYWP